ncbi:MAG: HlyD family secretion protein [Saprospiraceae bacterium]
MSTPKRRRTLWYILAGVLALLIVAAAVKARQKPKGEKVNAEKVERRTIRETVSASGKIFPETEVKISSDVSGEIVEMFVKEGDSVTAGQILAKIRPDEYQSAVERGQASVNSARSQRGISSSNVQGSIAAINQLKADQARIQAQLSQARNAHERNEKLFREGVIAQAELETTLSNLKTLESTLAANQASIASAESNLSVSKENVNVSDYGITSAQASLKELRTSLQKTVITAPVSGIITQLNVEKGERVVGTLQMTGTEMMRISQLGSMEVQVDVSENDILKVSMKDEVDIEVDAYLGRKFKGIVSEIGNSASNLSTTTSLNTDQVTNFVVKIRVDPKSYADLMNNNNQYPFRPGMSASVDIYTHTAESVLTLPIIAVTAKDEDADKNKKKTETDQQPNVPKKEKESDDAIQEIVFVVTGDTVGVRNVKTGIQDNNYIEILEGLQEGEEVVTGPYSAIARKLKSGTRVTIEDEKAKKAGASGAKVSVEVD